MIPAGLRIITDISVTAAGEHRLFWQQQDARGAVRILTLPGRTPYKYGIIRARALFIGTVVMLTTARRVLACGHHNE